MKRLLILLLICLLPLQVFAGMRMHDAGNADAVSWQKASQQASQPVDAAALADVDSDEDGASHDSYDSDESLSQPGAGDETFPTPFLVFLDHPPGITHDLRHDAVRQPPFLPLPGRPPRV